MPIANSLAAAADELRAWRQDFHRHPELGYEEHRTAATVAQKLRDFGLDAVEEGIGGTGVVGVLHGRNGPGDEDRSIMLRADMDALPMVERGDLPYKSEYPGKMHACGHDGHITMLLGAARLLAETRGFDGTVYFCFQPAEEGGAGAAAMLRDGLFTRFPCRAIYGMHNWPSQPVGSFFTRAGPLLAASDEFMIDVTGRGSHAALPHTGRDPVVCAAAIVLSLQTIVSRRCDAQQPLVVSISTINAGSASNVIPETAEMLGTVRCFDEALHAAVHDDIRNVVEHIAAAHDLSATLEISDGSYPPTVNDAAQTEFCLDVARDVAGAERITGDIAPTMGSEDFAFFAREKPACFMLIGNGDSETLHHPAYDFNDETSVWGASYWVRLAERALPPE